MPAAAAANIENDSITRIKQIEQIKQVADGTIAPVLVSFVWWVLTRAEKSGQKKLYFLARDGYIMYRIAEQFRERFNLDIECRYLCGSRLAWRTAVYYLLGGEKYEYIFAGGYTLTPRIILKRIQADEEQRREIYADISEPGAYAYDLSNENDILSPAGMKIFSEKLKRSEAFNGCLNYISQNQFGSASAYLRQEGVFDGPDIGLVDSGWTGTVQRTLRQIAGYNGVKLDITGYYFGLHAQSSDPRDGIYESWYFSPKSPVGLMANFNNNVFECMCASPFKMTAGYGYSENLGIYVPVFSGDSNNNIDKFDNIENIENFENTEKAKLFNAYIERFAADFLENINFGDYGNLYLEQSRNILQRFMMNPTKEEAETIGRFKFCDDASDSYENSLARIIDKKYLKNYTVIKRFFGRIKKTKKNASRKSKQRAAENPDLFWFHGSLAISEIAGQKWYRFNYKLWETLRLLIKKYRTT